MTMGSASNDARNTENSINELIQESKLLESYFNDISSKESFIINLLEDAKNSIDAIRNLSSEIETSSLVPLGSGVYVKGNIFPLDKVLVNIGASVILEKNRDDAINFVEYRIKEFEIAYKQISSQKQQISARMMEIQNTVNSYVSQMQSHSHTKPNNNLHHSHS